jgi:hypothetical protein
MKNKYPKIDLELDMSHRHNLKIIDTDMHLSSTE